MTLADTIAVLNRGRIEQQGTPSELYERPGTAFVAGFLGVSNLLTGTVSGDGAVRLADGTEVRLTTESLAGRTGTVAVGIRPEKIRLGGEGENRLAGTVAERAYIGVATEYIVDTRLGRLIVYAQNDRPGAAAHAPGTEVTLAWSTESTFAVDPTEEIA